MHSHGVKSQQLQGGSNSVFVTSLNTSKVVAANLGPLGIMGVVHTLGLH